MARRFSDDTLVIASHNPGKVREISALLGAHVRHIRSAGELGLPEPEETGDSFVANAALKARAAAVGAGVAALADDSGLVVPALGGQPGIESARWAGPDRDFGHAMKRIENLLPEHADRGARFVCALALCWPDGHLEVFEGRVDGRLAWPPRGKRGFGYDPMFVADGFDETFGEIDPVAKEAVSHRTDAFRALVAACFDG